MEKAFILFIFLLFPSLIAILRQLLRNLHLWQVKEYRLDRVISYLRYERDYIQSDILMYLSEFAVFIVGLGYLIFPSASYLSVAYILAYVLMFFQFELFIKELYSKKLIRPRLKSVRNILITAMFMAFVIVVFSIVFGWLSGFGIDKINFELSQSEILESDTVIGNKALSLFTLLAGLPLLTVLFIDLTLPVVVGILVFFTAPLSTISRSRTIQKAKNKMNRLNQEIKVVAITGSYGKSTTKELLYEILSTKYKTAKTPVNLNTSVGVAQSVLSNIDDNTEVFIAEIGAYKKGEIRHAANIIQPDISVITALGEQHVSLFGSKEKLYDAKFEIIESLSKDGIAVLNGNDENCLNMASRTDNKTVFFYHLPQTEIVDNIPDNKTFVQPDKNDNLYVRTVEEHDHGTVLGLIYKGKEYKLDTELTDKRFALNLTAAVTIALLCGMTIEEVIHATKSIKQPNQLPKIVKGINDSVILDDGKTSNASGFQLALDMLNSIAKGRKIVMTQGIIELGKNKTEVYKNIADKIIKTTDILITNDKSLALATNKASKDFKIIKVNHPHEFAKYFKYNINKGDSVLVEGILPQNVLDQIIDE